MRTRGVLAGVAVTAMLLAGCTPSGGDADKTGSADQSESAESVPTQGGVLVEQTIDTPHRPDTEAHGGTVTVIVRSVVASEGRTVVSWALRWDDPEVADDTLVPLGDLIEVELPTLIDGQALKYYYPLCGNDYHNVIGRQNCGYYARYYPRVVSTNQPDLVNHQAMEGWAIFPEVGGDTTSVDLALSGGLPTFSELRVTRP